MKRALELSWVWIIASGVLVGGCAGPAGPEGKQGEPGTSGTSTPSVSAVTPAYAYVGRTLDLTIAGSGTSWSSSTTVTFADPGVTVNKVTSASASGLLVNVTIGATATIAATDVTVTDGSTKETYDGAFQIRAPLLVSLDQTGGVPQGGFANVDVQMLDITTPFDPNNLNATLSVTDVSLEGTPTANSDYDLGFFIAADVLATAGESVNVVVQSGPTGTMIDSPQNSAFKVVARAPTVAPAGMDESGMIATTSDSSLYKFTPAAASLRFVQYNVSSSDNPGGPAAYVIDSTGKWANALSGFFVRQGAAVTSTAVSYAVVTDGGGLTANPPPYSFDFTIYETPCTALTFSGTHTSSANALAVTALPALAMGNLGDGTTTTGDWYTVHVTSGQTLHAASGGDPLSAVSLTLWDINAVDSTPDGADDYHKDVTLPVTTTGAYYVQVTPDASGNYDPTHPNYDLLIQVQ